MNIIPSSAHVAIPAGVSLPPGIEGENWALFLSTLALHTSLTRERRCGGHWINFHNERLSKLLGRRYRLRIDAMIDAKIVERNDCYSTGMEGIRSFTKSYRLSTQHRTGQSRLHVLTSRPAVRKAIKTFDIDPANLRPAGMHYRSCFDRFALHPDAANDPRLKDHWDQWTVARWRNRQEFARRCDYGRYHCLTSQLPCSARCHLRTCDGEPLSIVDVSACQPLLLGYLAARHAVNTTYQLPKGHNLLPYDAHFLTPITGRIPPDVARWIELCESRSIYRYFHNAIQSFDGTTTKTITTASGRKVVIDLRTLPERNIKRSTLIPLFDTIQSMNRSPFYAITRHDFPTIATFIVSAKQAGHQRLACLLQRTESTLMIDGVGGELMRRFPDVPCQPIHDALLVPESFAETAAELIREQFAAIGLTPGVKIERCERVVKFTNQGGSTGTRR